MMAKASKPSAGVIRHVAAAGVIVGTVVVLAVLRMTGLAPGWFIGAVVVLNVAVVAAMLMHLAGEGRPVIHVAAFTAFLLAALGVLSWYSERGGYEGEVLHGFITMGLDAADSPGAESGHD